MINNIYRRIEKWFDLNIGWFFVNPNKQDRWIKYLNEKYKD